MTIQAKLLAAVTWAWMQARTYFGERWTGSTLEAYCISNLISRSINGVDGCVGDQAKPDSFRNGFVAAFYV